MSFLTNYSTATSGNESPVVFHNWAGLSALSSLMSRRVWIDCGFFTVYPNMYVLLVGKPGIKKSTAMSVARRLIREIQTIPIAPPSITKEAMTQLMAEDDSPCKKNFIGRNPDGTEKLTDYTHLSLFCNEFVTLLNSGGNASGMIELLTDIWDEDRFEVKTKNKGTDYIMGPFLTLLGCLTTETMSSLMNTKILQSGFNRRCVLVYSEDYGTPVAIPTVTVDQERAWNACIDQGKRLQKISGAFTWGEGAKDWWIPWYNSHHEKKKREENPILEGFYNSKPEYVLKIAMLTTLSETESLVLTPEHLALALSFIDQIEPEMTVAFDGTGRNELGQIASAIEKAIVASRDPMKVNKVHALFYNQADTDEINKILEHLHRVGKISRHNLTVKKGTVIPIVAKPDFDLASYQRES